MTRHQRPPRRLPSAERKQLPLVQAHAFDHYLKGQCNGAFPIDNARQDLRCPLCFEWRGVSEFTIDHAPQDAGQSRFGPSWSTVLTCSCNNAAGATFERVASEVRRSGALDGSECSVHGDVSVHDGFDPQFMNQVEATTFTDLKSAYLIAFVVLGYSWCSAPRLRSIRDSISSESLIAASEALVTCGLASDAFPERSVVEVTAPIPLVLVVGPERAITVALPGALTPDVEVACQLATLGPVKARVFAWPLTVRKTARALNLEAEFVKPEDAWDLGMTFHLDRCDQKHAGIVSPTRELTRGLNR